jgi:hypothetical protein
VGEFQFLTLPQIKLYCKKLEEASDLRKKNMDAQKKDLKR